MIDNSRRSERRSLYLLILLTIIIVSVTIVYPPKTPATNSHVSDTNDNKSWEYTGAAIIGIIGQM